MGISRCICHDVSFSQLLQLAKDGAGSFEALRERTMCGTSCGLCRPYILLLLQTGKTDLPLMSERQLMEALGGAPAPACAVSLNIRRDPGPRAQ